MRDFFSPTPGRLGIMPTLLSSGALATGTLAAGTLTQTIGGYPGVPAVVSALCVSADVFPTAATSCAVRVLKYDASAAATVPLTGSFSINNITDIISHQIPLLSTLTDVQRIMAPGDVLRVEIVTVGVVSVQPEDVVVVAEILPIR